MLVKISPELSCSQGRRNDFKSVWARPEQADERGGGGGGGDSDTFFGSDFKFVRHLYLIQVGGSPPICPTSVVTREKEKKRNAQLKKWVGHWPTWPTRFRRQQFFREPCPGKEDLQLACSSSGHFCQVKVSSEEAQLWAVLKVSGTTPDKREILMILMITGRSSSIQEITSHVGRGSKLHGTSDLMNTFT